MASRFVNNDAQRALKRINGEISIGSEDKKDFLNIAKAHFAAGNSGDAVTMITALGRFDERNEIDNRLAALEQRQTQSTQVEEVVRKKDVELSDIGVAMSVIAERLDAIEGKIQ